MICCENKIIYGGNKIICCGNKIVCCGNKISFLWEQHNKLWEQDIILREQTNIFYRMALITHVFKKNNNSLNYTIQPSVFVYLRRNTSN